MSDHTGRHQEARHPSHPPSLKCHIPPNVSRHNFLSLANEPTKSPQNQTTTYDLDLMSKVPKPIDVTCKVFDSSPTMRTSKIVDCCDCVVSCQIVDIICKWWRVAPVIYLGAYARSACVFCGRVAPVQGLWDIGRVAPERSALF